MEQNESKEQNEQKITLIGIYVALLGLVTLAFGIADILVWAGIRPGIQVGILAIAGDDFFRWAWGGFIMICAGLFMLAGAPGLRRFSSLQR